MRNEQIIRGFLDNDASIIQQCYAETEPIVAQIVRSNSGVEQDVQDVLQYTLTTFFLYCQKGFKLEVKFSTFVYSIAYRHWMKELRNRRKTHNTISIDGNSMPKADNISDTIGIDVEAEAHKSIVVKQALTLLGKECQKMIDLKYKEQKSHKEISQLMEFSEQYSRLKLSRCKEKLSKLLQEQTGYQLLLEAYPFLRKLK